MSLNQAMILAFWVASAIVIIAATKLVSCHYGDGLYPCGTLAYLAFLLGAFTIMGTIPFVVIDLLVTAGAWSQDTDDTTGE